MVYIDLCICEFKYAFMYIMYVDIYLYISLFVYVFRDIDIHTSDGMGKVPQVLQPHEMQEKKGEHGYDGVHRRIHTRVYVY